MQIVFLPSVWMIVLLQPGGLSFSWAQRYLAITCPIGYWVQNGFQQGHSRRSASIGVLPACTAGSICCPTAAPPTRTVLPSAACQAPKPVICAASYLSPDAPSWCTGSRYCLSGCSVCGGRQSLYQSCSLTRWRSTCPVLSPSVTTARALSGCSSFPRKGGRSASIEHPLLFVPCFLLLCIL